MGKKDHRQWSSLRMVFHPNREYPAGTPRKGIQPIQVESPDAIQCSITKDISQAAGGFTATLVPRQEYLTSINPNDWVEIFLDNGDGAKEPLMVASVDRISRRRAVASSGATSEVISLSGRDYGKVFLSIMIIIDPLIGSIIDQTTFQSEVIVSKFSKNDIGGSLNRPNEVIAELLKRYHDSRVQCLLPTSLLKHSILISKLSRVQGRVVLNFNPNLGGNLWTTMQQYTNGDLLNEFWVDTVDGAPTLFLHERPYSHDTFAALDSVAVMETEVTQEDIGKSDTDVKNWVRVYADAQYLPFEALHVANTGYTNGKSVARSGLRKLELTTNAFGEFSTPLVNSQNGSPSGLLQDWAGIIAEWNTNNDLLLAGSMTTRLRPDARIGRRLDYTNERTSERLSFYIEGISHSFVYPGASTTNFSLTRGVERDAGTALKFPLLKSLDEILLTDDGRLTLMTQIPASLFNEARAQRKDAVLT